MSILEISVELIYMVAIALFVVGLKRMTSPATARAGNQMAAVAMLIGVAVTLLDRNILNFDRLTNFKLSNVNFYYIRHVVRKCFKN